MLDQLQKFDPSEPRDETGKWTSGGSGSGSSEVAPTSFISPNTSTLTFDQAVLALNGERQKQITAASKEIDEGLGITSHSFPAIGAWSDGAENSLMVVAPGASAEQIRVASAMKGYIADQKAVLTFMPDVTGSDFLASFPVQGNVSEIHDQLLKAGLSFHTLQPHGDHIIVHAYGSDQDAIDAVNKAASGFGANPEFIKGGGEFIGTKKEDGTDREQRDDARQEYEKVIEAARVSSELEGHDVGALWNSVRDRWSAGPAGDSDGQQADKAGQAGDKGQVKAFNPDEPRDELGQWTDGGSHGGSANDPGSISSGHQARRGKGSVVYGEAKDGDGEPVYWHGSASGDLRGGSSGLHLGTFNQATVALEARIGIPADGNGWRGNETYGKTKLAGKDKVSKLPGYRVSGFNAGFSSGNAGHVEFPKDDFYPADYFKEHPDAQPKYPDGSPMPLTVVPRVEPFRIVGEMKNSPEKPISDAAANRFGKKSKEVGAYYDNEGEGEGVSAVVPNGSHLEALEIVWPKTKERGFPAEWTTRGYIAPQLRAYEPHGMIGYIPMKPKFAQMTLAEASTILPPELFRKYYVAASEFFDANAHLSRGMINDLVVVVRASPLYVHRDLQNVGEFTAWATAQGFTDVADDLHVTVLYSKSPVDWSDMSRDTAKVTVPAGGERSLEQLGDEGAVVLRFESDELAGRHDKMVDSGASHDYDSYVPHVTINLSGAIPDGAVPYDGKLVFGPEVFETIDLETKEWDESKHPRVPAGSPEGGEFGEGGGGGGGGDTSTSAPKPAPASSNNYGMVPGDAEKFDKLYDEWSTINNELGRRENLHDPGGPESVKMLHQLEALAKEMHTLHADAGDAKGIYKPGGPLDTLVIGSGPGGLAAAISGGAEGLDTQIIEAQLVAGGQAKYSSRIENYMGFPIGVSGQQLTQSGITQAQRLGAELTLGVRVTGMTIDDDGVMKHVTLSNGQTVDTRTVIIGGGIEFRKVNFPGSEGPGIVLGDAEELAQTTTGERVVVVGGSNGASQAALRCAENCEHVFVLSRSPISSGMSAYQVNALKNNPKITVIENDQIDSLERDEKGNPKTLKTKGGQMLAIGAIGIFAGGVPNTKWLPEEVSRDYRSKDPDTARLRTNAALQVVDELDEPIPGVFAVGDMRDGAMGRIGIAAGEGMVALKHAQDYLEKIRKAAGLAPKEPPKQPPKEKADAAKKTANRKLADEWITGVFDVDRANPWFGQTVDDQPPVQHGPSKPIPPQKKAQKKSQIIGREFDESKHPREPAGSPTGGEFTSGGGGETSPEGSSEKFDPKVVEVGGDAWNRGVARKLEREYQKAKPALDKIKNNAVKDSAGQSGWKSISHDDQQHAFNAWRKEEKIDDYDEANAKWNELTDEEKTKIAVDHGVVAAVQVLEGYKTGKDDWESLSAEQQETAKQQWVEEHENDFDTDDDPKVAAGDHFDGLPDKEKFEYAMTGPQTDEDEPATITPEDWDTMSEDQQTETEEKWKKDNYDNFHESEVQNWSEETAPDDARYKAAEDYNDGSADEWARDALDELRDTREEEGKPEIPFDNIQLINAIKLNYETGYGGGSYWKKQMHDKLVEFDDEILHIAKAKETEGQAELPGIEAPDYSKLLTDEMRDDITDAMIDGLETEGERIGDKIEPPDYLGESVDEQLDSYWGEMSDKQKFKYAQEQEIVKDVDVASSGTSIENAGDAYRVMALPSTYDPLNETSGQDYVRTQRLARHMSITRAVELIKERGIPVGYAPEVMAKQPKLLDDALKAVDRQLWEDWKSSSTSQNGKLLQVATAEELGGRLNPKTSTGIDVDEVKSDAGIRYQKIGGYSGVLAYIRAKWETTQYLLDKAGQSELELYRGLDLGRHNKDRFDEAMKEKSARAKRLVMVGGKISQGINVGGGKTYEKLPTVKVDRNGAASTTTDINVANGWARGGSGKITLRAVVPRTAAISIPAYGVNIHSEHEVVIAGTAWKAWDAWAGSAPRLSEYAIGTHGTGIGTSAPVQQAA